MAYPSSAGATRSGPTRYYFYYGGVRHYHGTRTWGQCNGHCNQDVYIDQVSFKIYYASGTQADTMLASTAKTALSQVWPSIDPTLVTTAASSVGGPHVQFTALLPDGTGTYAFADAVKNSVTNYCLSNIPSPLSSTGMPVSCPQTVAVSVMQIATQAESGGAALTLPSLLCLVLAAVSTMSTMWR
jgi:hypothetical protein